MAADALALTLRLSLSSAADQALVVQSVRGHERLNEPFRYRAEVLSEELDLDATRGAEASLAIEDHEGRERFIHGVVEELSVRPTHWEDRYLYELVIVPEASLLRHRHGYALFQAMSVPDIVRQVLARAGLPEERFEWSLARTYAARDLCCQYDESEWDFVNRLLEDEGIAYRFDHAEDRHVMVFNDENRSAPRAEPDPLVFDPAHDALLSARAHDLAVCAQATVSRVEVGDFDGWSPARDLRARAQAADRLEREHYEYPAGHRDEAGARRNAQARLDTLRAERRTIELETNAMRATCGQRASITGASVPVPDGLIVATELAIAPAGDRWTVVSSLRLIPIEHAYRPARRTPRPRVVGVQTARVTGPAGQESHVDERGRVKVQFHWDRYAQLDDRSSAWIPVAHGQTTGSVALPRVGWEVLVEHQDGDPDRPIVTGRVYNSHWPPPYPLPEWRTVTAHRSDSLPGRAVINEVRFEDRAGREHVSVSAGRDLREVAVLRRDALVHHDERREIGVARSEVVGVLQARHYEARADDSVGAAQTLFVGHDRSVDVGAALSRSVQGDQHSTIGRLDVALVGDETPGALYSLLRPADEGAGEIVWRGVRDLVLRAQTVVADHTSRCGSAQEVLTSEEPSLTSVLGQVVGRLTDAPDRAPDPPPPEEAQEEGEAPARRARGGGRRRRRWRVLAGPRFLSEEDEHQLDALYGDELRSATPVGALGEGALDAFIGTDEERERERREESSFLDGFGPVLSHFGEVSRALGGARERTRETAQHARQAASIAQGARGLVSGGNPLEMLGSLGEGLGEGSASEPEGPFGFLERVVPDFEQAERAIEVFTRVRSLFQSVLGEDLHAVRVEAPVAPEVEWSPPHFAASAAEALMRGAAVANDAPSRRRDDEDDELESDDDDLDDEEEVEHDDEREEEEQEPEPRAEPRAEAEPGPEGTGMWSSDIGGDCLETIAGVHVLGARQAQLGVGANAAEIAGLARIEAVGESWLERAQGGKTETYGAYVVTAAEGVDLTTQGTHRTVVSGEARVRVGGALTVEAGGSMRWRASELRLDGAQRVVFECGAARVVIDASGLSITGTEIIVRGSVIGVDSPALG